MLNTLYVKHVKKQTYVSRTIDNTYGQGAYG